MATQEITRRTGRVPRRPMAVVYETAAGNTWAVAADPAAAPDVLYRVRSSGPHAALGALHDQDYRTGALRTVIPEWLLTFLPEGATALGSAFIR